MLTVVGIIAIIAALLLPALSRAKSYAQTAVCMNNMRQLSLATSVYAGDHDACIPRDYTPSGACNGLTPLLPEVCADNLAIGQFPLVDSTILNNGRDRLLATIFMDFPILQCPAFPDVDPSNFFTKQHPWTGERVTVNRQTWTYTTNAYLFTGQEGVILNGVQRNWAGTTRLTTFPDPAAYVYLIESDGGRPIDQFDFHDAWAAGNFHLWSSGGCRVINDSRHLSQANASFFDGHIERRKYYEFNRVDFCDR